MTDLPEYAVTEMADILRLMGEPNRLKILVACLNKAHTITEFAEQLKLSPPLISHHIRLLKALRLVRAQRQGKHVLYTVDDEHVRCILNDMLAHFATDCHNKLGEEI